MIRTKERRRVIPDWAGVGYVLLWFLALVAFITWVVAVSGSRFLDATGFDVRTLDSDTKWQTWAGVAALCPVLIVAQVTAVVMWLYAAEWALVVWVWVRRLPFRWINADTQNPVLKWLRGGPLKSHPAFWWKPWSGRSWLRALEWISIGFALGALYVGAITLG